MGDAPPIVGTAHEFLIHVVRREIACNAGKKIDIAFGNSLPEGRLQADNVSLEFRHVR
jgi:hypothetical protein